ncbi:DNA polymerase Y family protein [Halioxenophilus sp. WMMB6]|uniref:Y-family DNA polymerase n=1 Tax=Halioxenophilus sp. WMMB6 TaxID=3073815 RepID=UPI00295E2939|nr:DNA polymerase Y family protein [Halioxenophilus sp. WMMB6]
MLWLALRLPLLPLDVFKREATTPAAEACGLIASGTPSLPLLVYHAPKGSKQVLLCNDTSEAVGVRQGMSLVTAEALLQVYSEEQADNSASPAPRRHYRCYPRDVSREWVALQQLAGDCYDFTPHVSLHNAPELGSSNQPRNRQAGLLLEISGSLKLFKGLENLCQQLLSRLAGRHCFVQPGLGLSPESAWLLANTRQSINSQYSSQDYVAQLAAIELNKLDRFDDSFSQLQQMGLSTLGEVLAMPMVELGRRFGEAFIGYLYALLGQQNHALMRRPEAAEFRRRVQLNFPVTNLQQLQPVVSTLLQQLADFLRREQQQCEAIEWLLLSATGQRQAIPIVCQPVHGDWQLLQQLTQIHFEHLALAFEVDSVELYLSQHSPFTHETGDLFAADPELALDRAEVQRRWQLLLTRLHNRLGNNSTLELQQLPEHWPEQLNHWQASQIQSQSNARNGAPAQVAEAPAHYHLTATEPGHTGAALAPRPSWLIDPPVALSERNHRLFWHGPLTLLLGPERLQGRWWLASPADASGQAQCRDYFIAEQDDYRRLWIFHDHQAKGWFLQGVFG